MDKQHHIKEDVHCPHCSIIYLLMTLKAHFTQWTHIIQFHHISCSFAYGPGQEAKLECILVRRRTKTQKYKGALFEQLERVGPNHAQLKAKQYRKQNNTTRQKDQKKVNK